MPRKLLHGILIGLGAGAVALALMFTGALDRIENVTWDGRVRMMAKPGPATGKIRLILIDQTSLDWGRDAKKWDWPWPREVFGAVLSFCKRGGAKAFIDDALFTEASRYGVDDDQAFGEAVAKDGPYVTALWLSKNQGLATKWPADLHLRDLSVRGLDGWLKGPAGGVLTMPRASFPIPEIASNAALLGSVYFTPDGDGIERRSQVFNVFDGRFVPSLALAGFCAAEAKAELSIEGDVFRARGTGGLVATSGISAIPLDRSGRTILRFRGPTQTHKAVNVAAVIESELLIREKKKPLLDPEDFRDCYVFLGSTAPGLMDLKPSPVGRIYPGVEIHATFLDNLLSGDFLRDAPWPAVLACTFALALLAGIAGRACQSAAQTVLAFVVLLPVSTAPAFVAYGQGLWMPMVGQTLAVVLALVGAVIVNYAVEGRQKRFIKNAFKQYLSPHVIDKLVKDPTGLKLGGETRELSIYFSDVQGFTTIAESLSPEKLTALLNEYLTAMTDVIMEEGGTVDKYEGDAVIAFWNAPLDLPDHAKFAVRAALRCQAKLAEIRPVLKERYGKDVFARIGLNTGNVVIGNMGSSTRFNYTFLGDAGNLASRLEGANKQFGTFLMISEHTLSRLGGEFPAREISRIRVVGKREPIRVYEPMTKEDFAARGAMIEVFDAGLKAYYAGRFREAVETFSKISDVDAPAAAYVAACRDLVEHSPAQWEGVWEMREK